MRTPWWTNTAISACLLIAAGCASGPGASSKDAKAQSAADAEPARGVFSTLRNAVSSILPTKENELKRMLAAGSFWAAADFWVAHQEALLKSSSSRSNILSISNGIGGLESSEASSFAAALQPLTVSLPDSSQRTSAAASQHWSSSASNWGGLKAQLAAAETFNKRVREHPFFVTNPTVVPPSIRRLDEVLVEARKELQASATHAFVKYDHRSSTSFFDAYPLELPPRLQTALAVRGSAFWLKALLAGTEDEARRVVKAYAPLIRAQDARNMIASAYAGVVARERKWNDERTLQQVIQLLQALESAGLDASAASRSVKIGILRGLNSKADHFRWTSSHRTASTIAAHDLPINALDAWVREVASVKPNEIFILVDPSRTSALWQLISLSPRAGVRQVGQRVERNPAWDRARQEVEEARSEYANVSAQDQQAQAQAQQLASQSRTSGMLALLSSSASSMSVISAKRRLTDAESAFASTPDTISTPVTRRYTSVAASFEAIRERETAIYVVYGKSAQFFRVSMPETIKASDQIVFGIDPSDPGFSAATTRNRAAHQRFRHIASSSHYSNADEIWKRLTNASEAPTTPLSSLVRTIREDHSRWSEAATLRRNRAQSSTENLEQRVLKIAEAQ